MGFFKKIASIFGLGISKDDNHDHDHDNGGGHHDDVAANADVGMNARPSKGFSGKETVMVERAYQGPIITPCDNEEGGVQGFRWYANRLRVNEDGDVAEEFLDEVLPESSSQQAMDDTQTEPQSQSKLVIRRSSRPARVKDQAFARDGNLHLCVEFNGKSIWV